MSADDLCAMQITTSFGRRLKATNKGMPWEHPEDGSSEWHDLVSPYGKTITGFLAHAYVSSPFFYLELRDTDLYLPR